MIYDDYKVYGPYVRNKDGRKHVILVHKEDGKRKTISYPKFLYEQHYDVMLLKHQTIDHQDRDYTNDSISNLVVRDRKSHAAVDSVRVQLASLVCCECSCVFKRSPSKQDSNSNQGKAGPFCGRSCAGKYSRRLQLGGSSLPTAERIKERVYYRQDKCPNGEIGSTQET